MAVEVGQEATELEEPAARVVLAGLEEGAISMYTT